MTGGARTIVRTTCRLCAATDLRDVFSLGDQFISDFVTRECITQGLRAPLDLVLCGRCSLLQLRHTAPRPVLYATYWYRSGVTDTMRAVLRDITTEIQSMVALEAGDVVLDIGANDGTLLASYTAPGIVRVGCEPADNLVDALRQNADVVIHDFWKGDRWREAVAAHGLHHAKVITAIAILYALEDPNAFMRDVREALHEDGIFVAQLMCLGPMLENNDLGNICHEHLEYYSVQVIERLLEAHGLEMFKIEKNAVNGGSYRIFARHARGEPLVFEEAYTQADVHAFARRVDANRERCVRFIEQEVARGKRVYVYGASTKGNVILQYYGLNARLIAAAAERSPQKWGKYTIGTGIPIISEEQARSDQPDYFLVLPWPFFDEFYAREAVWREGGGKFIVPLPEFRIV
jgi:hypothetical protein